MIQLKNQHVVCNKEVEIANMQKDLQYIVEKMDSLHDKVVGNGKPGLVDEMNQIKGSVNSVKFIYGALIGLIGVSVGIIGLFL